MQNKRKQNHPASFQRHVVEMYLWWLFQNQCNNLPQEPVPGHREQDPTSLSRRHTQSTVTETQQGPAGLLQGNTTPLLQQGLEGQEHTSEEGAPRKHLLRADFKDTYSIYSLCSSAIEAFTVSTLSPGNKSPKSLFLKVRPFFPTHGKQSMGFHQINASICAPKIEIHLILRTA